MNRVLRTPITVTFLIATFLLMNIGIAGVTTIEPGHDGKSLQEVLNNITVGGQSSVRASGAVNEHRKADQIGSTLLFEDAI